MQQADTDQVPYRKGKPNIKKSNLKAKKVMSSDIIDHCAPALRGYIWEQSPKRRYGGGHILQQDRVCWSP